MISAEGLGYTFVANDMASGPIKRLGMNVKTLAKDSEAAQLAYTRSMGLIKQGTKELLVGGLGLLAINSLTKSYGEFEYKLASAGAVMNATGSELRQLERAAIDAGIATQFSPTEAVAGLEALGAAGMSAREAIATLNPVLDLAAASLGQLGVADAATNVVGVLNAFGDSADYARKRVDQLVKITQMSNFQARDFSIALSQASAQAKAADQSFESMTATLGMLRNTNMDASSSATAYREAVRRVSGDLRAQKELKRLHINSLDEETGKIKDLSKIMTEVIPTVALLDAKKRNLALTRIFGVRGMKTYNAFLSSYNKLLKEGKVAVGDYAGAHRILVEGLEGSAGAAAKTRDKLLETSQGQRILLKGSIETFKVTAGKMLVPAVLPALKGLTDALNQIIQLIDKIPGPVKAFISHFVGAGAVLLALSGTMKIVAGARGLMALARSTDVAAEGAMGMTARFKAANAELAKMPLRQQATSAAAWRTSAAGLGNALGGALPFIGIAATGMMAISSYFDAQRAKERKRVQEVREQQRQLQVEYGKTAEMVKNVGYAAKSASDKLLAMGNVKALVEMQKRITDAMGKVSSAQAQLDRNLAIEHTKSLSKKEKAELDASTLKATRDRDAARKTIEQYKFAALRLRADLAGRGVIGMGAGERRRLMAAAGIVTADQLKQEEGEIKKGLVTARKLYEATGGQQGKEIVKQRERELRAVQYRYKSTVLRAGRLAGYGGGNVQQALSAAGTFAEPELAKVRGFGDDTTTTGLSQMDLNLIVQGRMPLSSVLASRTPAQRAALMEVIKRRSGTMGGTFVGARQRAEEGGAQPSPGGRGAVPAYVQTSEAIGLGDPREAWWHPGGTTNIASQAEIMKQALEKANIRVSVSIDGQDVPVTAKNANERSGKGKPSRPAS